MANWSGLTETTTRVNLGMASVTARGSVSTEMVLTIWENTKTTNLQAKVLTSGKTMKAMKGLGKMDFSMETELKNCLTAPFSMDFGSWGCRREWESANTQMDQATKGIGMKVSRMEWERKHFLMEPRSMADGSRARQGVTESKCCRMEQSLKAIGMNQNFLKANVSSLMGRFTMVNGTRVSQKATELKFGLMVVDTKASGSQENRLGRESKLTRMER